MRFQPPGVGVFEFVRVSSLRAAQLMRGCTARVPVGHQFATTAIREVAEGKIVGTRVDAVIGKGMPKG